MKSFLLVGALVSAAYIAGRYSAPEKIKIETKTQIKEVMIKDEHTDSDTRKSVTEITRPDGTTIKRTRSERAKITDSSLRREDVKQTEEKKEIENRRGVVVQFLAAAPGPVYGAAFTKQFLGPINIGAFMFTDMRIGISLGFEF